MKRFLSKFPRLFFWQAAIVLFLTIFVIIVPHVSWLRFTHIFNTTNGLSFFHGYDDIVYYYQVVDDFFVENLYPPANTYPPLTYLSFLVLRFIIELFGGGIYVYIIAFQAFMGVFLIGALAVFHRLLQMLDRPRSLSWLFFLPSFLFFIFSRFDIVVLLVLLLSFLFLFKKRYAVALVFLALTIVLKWFTVILVPFFFVYVFFDMGQSTKQQDPAIVKRVLLGWGIFLAIIVGSHLVIAALSGFNFMYQPYVLQLGRPSEIGSFLASLIGGVFFTGYIFFSGLIGLSPVGIQVASMVFTLVQFLPVFFVLSWARRLQTLPEQVRKQEFLLWAGLLIANFVLWNRIYSPQWVIWFLPFLLLPVLPRRLLWLLIVFDILNYLFFPVGYLVGSPWDGSYISLQMISLVRSLILLIMIALTARQLLWRSDGHFLSNLSPKHDS